MNNENSQSKQSKSSINKFIIFSLIFFVLVLYYFLVGIEKDKKVVNEVFFDESYFALVNSKVGSGLKSAKLYRAKCKACHGPNGEGNVGPNLTDSYWIHGKGTKEAIFRVLHYGVVDKGMQAWGDSLSKEDVYLLVNQVLKFKNTKIRGGKSPQGDEVIE